MEPRPSRQGRNTGSSSGDQPWNQPETAPEPHYNDPAEPNPTGGPWYGPRGRLGPEPAEYQSTVPPMPIKPRSERGNKWLRYGLAAILLAVVVGGSAFLVTRFLDDSGDDGDDPPVVAAVDQTPTPNDPVPTDVPAAADEEPSDEVVEPDPTEVEQPEQDTEEDPTQIPTPTESVESAGGEDEPAEDESNDLSAKALLPTPGDIDGSWSVFAEGARDKTEVAAQLGENGADLLESWSWRENQFRDFTRDDADAVPDQTSFLSVSVHRFASQNGAAESLDSLTDIALGFYTELEEVPVETGGDQARALAGPVDGANLYILYVRDGNYVIRLGGSSATGDPAPFVNAIAAELVGG